MSDLACDSPDSPPPPSYAISQHEFDQKTTRVMEESAAEPPEPRVDEDGFEIWDDSVFEVAMAAMNSLSVRQPSSSTEDTVVEVASGSTPSRPPEKARADPEPRAVHERSLPHASGSTSRAASLSQTRPLRVTKRVRPGKERPSWAAEARPDASPRSSSVDPQAGGSSQQEGRRTSVRSPRRQLTVFNNTGDVADPERELTPPPEFTPVGPSLDGPPYEMLVMAYDGPELDPPDSLPEPPSFDSLPDLHAPASLQPTSRPAEDARVRPSHAHTLPVEPTVPAIVPTRPPAHHAESMPPCAGQTTTSAAHVAGHEPSRGKLPATPRLAFDPRTAYSKQLPAIPQDDQSHPQAFDASAFYSHAVASHFSTNIPARMRQPGQSDRSSVYGQEWSIPMPSVARYRGPPDKVAPMVASPKPTYAYGQAAFPHSSSHT
ncbi:hypothetical protein BV20DRAFT_932347 [Pilatotrama ljubarskyi]|nr:hypothetical protein BV20DRAFT_932347 [Pilatotrama ljubarskyi]